MNNVEYNWKNLCITILPGMTLIGMICLMTKIGGCEHCAPVGVEFVQLFDFSSWQDTTLLLFLAVYMGYMINNVASIVERMLKTKDKNQAAREHRHEQMASIKHSDMIEEYFTHYAMARNMLFAHIILLIALPFCACICGSNHFVYFALIYMLIVTLLLCFIYNKHLKRYKEVIKLELKHQQPTT